MIGTKSKDATKLDAQESLNRAVEWAELRSENTMAPIGGEVWALISIAASLREIAGKLRRR
jgi:hypothetical protein